MPQEIEQFANRLRSHDLFIRIFINRRNAVGDSLDIINYRPCNFKLDDDEIRNVHSIIRSCNAMIERNPIEYRYNSLVASIIRENNYVEYNEIENKYYLNEIAYKIIMFERKYRDYVQQLPVLAKGMMGYGYRYDSEDLGVYKGIISEDFIVSDDINNLIASVKATEHAKSTRLVDELLEQITADRIGIYQDVMKGLYDIRKGDDWKENVIDKKMVVKSIEIFEKVVPIVTSMNRYFDIDDIKSIFTYCQNSNGTYSFSAIMRVKLFMNMYFNSKLNRLDLPIKEFMDDTYRFVDMYQQTNGGDCPVTEFRQFIADKTLEYARRDSNDDIVIEYSPLTMESYTKTLEEIFKCLIQVSRPRGPKNAKVLHFEPYEMMWKDKHEKYTTFAEQAEYLSEFLDKMQVNESRISYEDIDDGAIQRTTPNT